MAARIPDNIDAAFHTVMNFIVSDYVGTATPVDQYRLVMGLRRDGIPDVVKFVIFDCGIR